MRVRVFALFALAGALSAGAAPPRKQTVMLRMSDGVRLATDVYLPGGKGPFPVILSRTPYNKNRGRPARFLRQGCAVVRQDMRGRFGSGGENLPFIGCGWADHPDGAETVAWIARQRWCNGKIGTFGGSAGGITQNLLAGAAPKGLTCQYITVAAASLYHHAAYVGGALRQSQVVGWLRQNRFSPKALQLYAAHPSYDEFWRKFDSTAKAGVMTAPAVHVGGWFDTFSQGTVDAFVSRQTRGGRGAKGTQKLVMGPWAHGSNPFGKVGELKFPAGAVPLKYSPVHWFARHLTGLEKLSGELPAVAYYVMGDSSGDARKNPGNEWRYADAWPIPCDQTPYYLHAGGGLLPEKPAVADGKPTRAEYTFDPADPCPTVGGCNLNLPKGPMNQNRIEARKDVVCFTTPPLKRPLEVTGNVVAKLFVSSSAVDTDLSVRLCDVYPHGASYLMAEGMLRLRYRDGFEEPEPLTPNETYEVTVTCWPTSIVFNTGHRIRVTITSSNHPRFDVNPGTGRGWKAGYKSVKQTNRIYCDGAAASCLILPVVPSR